MSADAQRARLERERLEFLTELYNLSEGDLNREIDVGEIIDNLGISYEHVRIITRFFLEERLVFVHWAPPISDEALKAGIPQKVARYV